MKRILFMHHISSIGGASYCMLSLLKGVDKRLFEPIVLLREYGPLADEIEKLGVTVIYWNKMSAIPYNKSLLYFKSIPDYIKSFFYFRSFKRIVKNNKIDILYLNNMMLYPYLKPAKAIGCKTIMHVREHWPHNQHQLQMGLAKKYAEQYADWIIAISRFSASMFQECSKKMTIIHDWIDFSERYEPISFKELFGDDFKNLKVLVFTGGMSKIKGTLEIVDLFINHISSNEYRLLMMGSGLNYSLDGISGWIKRILMLTGWKPYGLKVAELIKSDRRIVCIPPTYKIVDVFNQAFCTVSYFTVPHANLALAEAISLDTMAIAAQTDESEEYSENANCAVLFRMNDKEDFIAKFDEVVSHYESYKKHMISHSGNIRAMFDKNKNIALLNETLLKIIQ